MINQLSILNFQAHKESILNFDSGVNVIIGSSDSGKSSILRALKWLFKNRPQGETFRSHWGGDTEVKVEMSNAEVTRSKGKQEEYSYRDWVIKDVTKFHAFRTEVPKEIQDALNISDINFQGQLDAPFLLSLSPGDVAAHFNRVMKLDNIDTGLQKVNSWIRAINQDIASKSQTAERLTLEVKQFDNLEKMEIEIEVLESSQADINVKKHGFNKLEEVFYGLGGIAEEMKEQNDIIAMEGDLNPILEKIAFKDTVNERILDLKFDMEEVFNIANKLKTKEEAISSEMMVDHILGLYTCKNTVNLSRASLLKLILDQKGINTRLEAEESNLCRLNALFEENFPEVCPLCGK